MGHITGPPPFCLLQHADGLGRRWGQKSAQAATATVNHWWERYEEFVGLNEVRDAQTKVTEVSERRRSSQVYLNCQIISSDLQDT